jgi:hypothetical protein
LIKKEWCCGGCGTEFESAIDVCKRCGAVAQRVFRTPVSINSSATKVIDSMLERNFAKRGISNYTNSAGAGKIEWASGTPRAFAAGDWRAGGWGKDQLMVINGAFGTAFGAPHLSGPSIIEETLPEGSAQPGAGWGKRVPTEVINQPES